MDSICIGVLYSKDGLTLLLLRQNAIMATMKQTTALKLLQSGNNVFITGSAGTGKTYLLKSYIDYLNRHQIYPTVVAPTGIAASHLGGQTIHSFFALGIREELDEAYLDALTQKKYLQKRFASLKVLIIDEVSMVSPELFDAMDSVLRAFKGAHQPFGGVQVVISGDFFQLPPISKSSKERRFAWQSEAWRALALQTCYLQEKFRQSDAKLIQILDDIRSGNISEASHSLLESRHHAPLTLSEVTRLYTHNIDVDTINQRELDALKGEAKHFICEHKGTPKGVEKIFKTSLVLEELVLKKGAVVICIKNNTEEGYVNGTTGVVESFSPIDNMPIVRTSEGKRIKLEPEEWSLENEHGKVVATVAQVPLRLAWAMTIHKSQGMTLLSAEIDLSRTFEVGQGYVALSRIKSLEGLRLLGLNPMALRVDPLILHIDSRIMNASQKVSEGIEALSKEVLKQREKEHIQSLGGVFSSKEKHQKSHTQGSQKPMHATYLTSTYTKTKNLIAHSNTLIELAQKRGLGKGTIIKHLIHLYQEGVALDIEKFQPPKEAYEALVTLIEAMPQSKKEGALFENIPLKPLYEALEGRMEYDEIRLGLLLLTQHYQAS